MCASPLFMEVDRMIELTNLAQQTVAVDQPVIFNTELVHSGCCERHRVGSSMISLLKPGRYLVMFSANIAVPTGVTAGEVSLALTLDGEEITATNMVATPADDGQFFNVSTSRYVDVFCGSYASIGVENNGGISVDVDSPNLIIVRVA